MQVAFRADASVTIGSGHVVRCATLAQALRAKGAEVLFLCRRENGDMMEWLQQQGVATLQLPSNGAMDQIADAAATCEGLDSVGFSPEWLVVDHYHLDQAWERAMRAPGRRILAIDDLANRPHQADMLLDQNLVAGHDGRYSELAAAAIHLLGPRFALLQPRYAEENSRARRRTGRPSRVMVYFGAGDLPNLTEQVVRGILAANEAVAIDMVIGSANMWREQLVALAEHPSVTAHLQLPSLVDVMIHADLAFGAGGATSWERICLGLPSVVVTLAENQRAIAEELQRRGLAIYVGDIGTLQNSTLRAEIERVLGLDVGQWFDATQSSLVDGRGAKRVAAAMIDESESRLLARPVEPRDESLLLDWANDPTTRRMGFRPQWIDAAGHKKWLRRRLADLENFRMFVVEDSEGVEVGQVRFEREADIWVISYSIAREFRGRGLATRVLDTALKALYDIVGPSTVRGRVRPENAASRQVFSRLRFTMHETRDSGIEFSRSL